MSVSPSIAKNTSKTYRSLHLIANKILELVYENALEGTILKWKKIENFLGRGIVIKTKKSSARDCSYGVQWKRESVLCDENGDDEDERQM